MTTIPDSDDEMVDYLAATLIRTVALGLAVWSTNMEREADQYVAIATSFEEYLRGEMSDACEAWPLCADSPNPDRSCGLGRGHIGDHAMRTANVEGQRVQTWANADDPMGGHPDEPLLAPSGPRLCGDSPDKDTSCRRPLGHFGDHSMKQPGVDRPITWANTYE